MKGITEGKQNAITFKTQKFKLRAERVVGETLALGRGRGQGLGVRCAGRQVAAGCVCVCVCVDGKATWHK